MIENIVRNIKFLMSKNNINNVTELARKTKIHQPTLHRLLAGDVQDPRYNNLKQLADFFKVNINDIVEKDLINQPKSAKTRSDLVPIVGSAQLGDNGFWTDMDYPIGCGDGFIQWPTQDKDAYALKCKGESMVPRIKSGEYVVVEPNHKYLSGDEVLIVTKDSRIMVKIYLYLRDSTYTLVSINENHPPIKLNADEIEKIHYVAGIAKESLKIE